ncbi:hypothetical protein [Aureibacter tunicatorum]|uniref:Leucine-rich repeat (LRR) protein n=1 Tax=Aureibacter tunicatorum TaxID=866807 RepID=A0AAE3XLG4_9BACT|nr:hypothetical protein [Aureibacter tunicatorum]MDR6240081.1 Leucine-rich repeat (LRR) protein [Aureibacter tunicatorum]BDD04552.1 hypothetical protein AUTU_20350 [Aureibacter tunicatorum]
MEYKANKKSVNKIKPKIYLISIGIIIFVMSLSVNKVYYTSEFEDFPEVAKISILTFTLSVCIYQLYFFKRHFDKQDKYRIILTDEYLKISQKGSEDKIIKIEEIGLIDKINRGVWLYTKKEDFLVPNWIENLDELEYKIRELKKNRK